MIFKENQPLV